MSGFITCPYCEGGHVAPHPDSHLETPLEECDTCLGTGRLRAKSRKPKAQSFTDRHVAISLALRDAHSTAVLAKLNGHFLADSLLEVARNALLAHGKSAEEIARSEASIEAGWRAGKRREWTPEGEAISEREVEALR